MNYRPEIDGLRALAVLPVVLFHAKFPLFGGGFVGVDIFFVISGYLITAILLESIESKTVSLKIFYERRARRILPALFTVLIASAFFSVFLLPPADLMQFAKSLVATVTFSANLLYWSQSGYFDTQSELKPLLHTWSLAVEEQFYLLFPILLLLLAKWRKKTRMMLLVLITVCSFVLALIAVNYRPSAAFFLLPTRAWELLAGALLAALSRKGVGIVLISPWWRNKLSLLGLLMLLLSLILFDEHSKFPGVAAIIPVTGTCLIILFATKHNIVGRVLSQSWLVSIGLISYSLYLWHNPILAFVRFGSEEPVSLKLAVFAIIISILVSFLTWRYIEKPCRNTSAVSSKALFIGLLITATILCGFSVYILKNVGLPERLGVNQSLWVSSIPSPLRARCHNSETHKVEVQNSCEYFGTQIQVATFGDSHVVELSYVLAERLKPYDIGVRQFSYTACPPSYGREPSNIGCIRWTKQAVDMILNSDVSTVVVSYRIHGALFGYHEKYYPQLPDLYSDSYREEIWNAYINVMKAFVNSGKQVVLVLQAPELKANISRLVFLHGQQAGDVVSMSREWLDQRERYVRERLSEIPKEVVIIDPRSLFCDRLNCYASKNGKALYFDEDHVSLYGAGILVDQIMPTLIQQNKPQFK